MNFEFYFTVEFKVTINIWNNEIISLFHMLIDIMETRSQSENSSNNFFSFYSVKNIDTAKWLIY